MTAVDLDIGGERGRAFMRGPERDRIELQTLRDGVSCAVVLEQEGFQIDKRESGLALSDGRAGLARVGSGGCGRARRGA